MQNPFSQLEIKATGVLSAMKTLPFILFALAMLALAACTPVETGVVAVGVVGGAMYLTKPSDPPPADLADQMPQHESWCYETAGYAECYSYPVRDAGNRLINVDPPNRYPLTPRAYNETVIESEQP